MTGAATSVVGDSPQGDGVYRDSNDWAKDVNRPNERAKFLAERACWDEILRAQADSKDNSATRLTTILPYFISGPLLYREAYNSSCGAVSVIITNTQYGFPEVQLPVVDVRDVAQAHILSLTNRELQGFNGRYLLAT